MLGRGAAAAGHRSNEAGEDCGVPHRIVGRAPLSPDGTMNDSLGPNLLRPPPDGAWMAPPWLREPDHPAVSALEGPHTAPLACGQYHSPHASFSSRLRQNVNKQREEDGGKGGKRKGKRGRKIFIASFPQRCKFASPDRCIVFFASFARTKRRILIPHPPSLLESRTLTSTSTEGLGLV